MVRHRRNALLFGLIAWWADVMELRIWSRWQTVSARTSHVNDVYICHEAKVTRLGYHFCLAHHVTWIILRIACLCEGNSPVTDGCPAQRASNIDGLVQDCSISSALAMEILQSCTKLSIREARSGLRLKTLHMLNLFKETYGRIIYNLYHSSTLTSHR